MDRQAKMYKMRRKPIIVGSETETISVLVEDEPAENN